MHSGLRRGSHTPSRRPGGLLLFQRPSQAAGKPNQSPAKACREAKLEFKTRRDSRRVNRLTAPLSLSLRSRKKEACGKCYLQALMSSQMCAQEELQDSALHRLTVTTRSPQSLLYGRSRRKTPPMSLSMRMQLLAFMNTPDQRHGPDVFSGLTLNHFLTLYQSQGAEETLALTRWSLWWNNVPQIWSLSRIIRSTVNVWGKL